LYSSTILTLQRWIAVRRGKAWARAGQSRPPKAAPAFIEIKAPDVSRAWAAEVVRADGSVIRLAHDAPAVLLRQLLPAC
jgi:hypothetical protein